MDCPLGGTLIDFSPKARPDQFRIFRSPQYSGHASNQRWSINALRNLTLRAVFGPDGAQIAPLLRCDRTITASNESRIRFHVAASC